MDGIYLLMQSDPSTGSGYCLQGTVNIGCLVVSVDELVAEAADKVYNKYADGPMGVWSRNFSNERICSLGWEAKVFLKAGIGHTFSWSK